MPLLTEDRLVKVCQREFELKLLCAASTLGLLFTVFSLLFLLDGDTGAYVVAVLNLPGLAFLTGVTGYLLYRCQQSAEDPQSPIT